MAAEPEPAPQVLTIFERVGEPTFRALVRKATPLWTRLTGKTPIAERVLRDILSQASTVQDVDRIYRQRHWRRSDYHHRPRRRRVLPLLRQLGVPER